MKKLNITTLLFCLILFAINFSAQLPSYVPTNSLVAWYSFNGNANDISSNGNNGTLTGATNTLDRFNIASSAINFNLISGIMCTSNIQNNPQNFSISLWFKTSSTNSWIFGFDNGQCSHIFNWDRYLSVNSNGNLDFRIYTSSNQNINITTNGIYNDNLWHHCVYSLANSMMSIFVDGQLVSSSINNITASNYQGYWRAGGLDNSTPSVPTILGKIDDIGIWNRALSSCEINQLYSASLATISIVASNSLICAGQNATLNVGGANTYTWSNSSNLTSVVVSPSVTMGYSVAGTNSAGCTSTSAINLTVNPNPIITVNNGTICAGQNFTINPNGANTYTIQGGSAVVSPTSNANYTVVGTSTAGCVSQSFATSSLIVNLCVGINNQNMGLDGVSIYPNPNNGGFTIELVSVNNTYITITNVLGQIIKTQKAELNNQINLNAFEKGIYFISVMENNQSVYKGSIIKEY